MLHLRKIERIMGIDQLLEKREEILRIAAKHGVRNVRIFGSVVRGEAGSGSDVDFLVEAGPDRTPFFPGGLLADLQELLGCNVDIVTDKALHRTLRDQVLKEAVPLWGLTILLASSRQKVDIVMGVGWCGEEE